MGRKEFRGVTDKYLGCLEVVAFVGVGVGVEVAVFAVFIVDANVNTPLCAGSQVKRLMFLGIQCSSRRFLSVYVEGRNKESGGVLVGA